MRSVLAMARLTLSEGIRMRVVLVFVIVLVFLLLRMPFALRGDETLAGRLQNFLSYSVTAVTVFMSIATVFFSCATLSNEFRSKTLHTVVTKPVTRFQILLGKWLGVNVLNLALVVLCGLSIYLFAQFIANQPVEFQRDRYKVRDTVLTARVPATPTMPDFSEQIDAYIEELDESGRLDQTPMTEQQLRDQKREELRLAWLRIPPRQWRTYRFKNVPAPANEDQTVELEYSIRAQPITLDERMTVAWALVHPKTGEPLMPPKYTTERMSDVHSFLLYQGRAVRDGEIALQVYNPGNRINSEIFFQSADDLTLYFPAGTFTANFVRAMLLVFFQLGFLSAIALFFATFVSFPIACLSAFTFLLLGIGQPFFLESIGANMEVRLESIDPYGAFGPFVRAILVPILTFIFPNLIRYAAAEPLSQGYYISWWFVLECAFRTFIAGLAYLFVVGWLIFRRREVAEVQVTS